VLTLFEALRFECVRSDAHASSPEGGEQPATPSTPLIPTTEVDPPHPASPGEEQSAASPIRNDSSCAIPTRTPPTATGTTAAAGAQVLPSQHFETPTPAVVQPDAMRDPEPMWCCVICQEVLLDPVTLPCGHHFDRDCVHCLLHPGEALLPSEPSTWVCAT
jgi:hypothetical protein